jgi:hypothetical protein
MTHRVSTESAGTATEPSRARLVLMEEGVAPGALAPREGDLAATAVVGMVSGLSSVLVHRIERRISELEHAAMTFAEVVFLLAPTSGEGARSRRLSVLRALLRRLQRNGAEWCSPCLLRPPPSSTGKPSDWWSPSWPSSALERGSGSASRRTRSVETVEASLRLL